MSLRAKEISDDAYVVRIVAGLLAGFFFAVGIKVGFDAVQASTAGMPMRNWWGGVMHPEKGMAIAALLAALTVAACFCAMHSQAVIDHWKRYCRAGE